MTAATITNCKVNHLVNPLGFDLGKSLRFSWNVENAKGSRQESARIIVMRGTDTLADTGFTDLNSLGASVKVPLLPRTKYSWIVTVKTDAGEELISVKNFFETGKMNEGWSGRWITCDTQERLPVFSKKFRIDKKKIKYARLYICGLGLYEAVLNGRRVGDEYLTPYCNNYNKWLQAQTYDVTAQLRVDKENEINVTLGHGWYSGRFGFSGNVDSNGYYGNNYMLIAELHVIYEDLEEQIFVSDNTWDVTRNNICFSNIYDGEIEDDTLTKYNSADAEKSTEFELSEERKTGERASLVSKNDLPVAPLVDRYSLPIHEISEFDAKKIITPSGEEVFDFGQEITGVFRVKVNEPRGTIIRFRTGEVLQDGNFYNDNLRTARSEYIYISDGLEHVLRPKFTFYGFRYIKASRVIGDIHESNTRYDYTAAQLKGREFQEKWKVLDEESLGLGAHDIKAIALSSDLETTGTVTTGNDLVNQLISNIEWGCRDNFLDVPTDCPQRDERMGWTADTQVFSPTACYLHDTYAFYRKFLHDMDLEQSEHNGGVPFTIPSFGVDAGSSVWGDAATIIPWNLYEFYGDKEILREQFCSMKAWVDYITSVDGENCGWRRAFHFGDWLALDIPGMSNDATSGETDVAFIADVYYMYSAQIVRDSATILGYQKEAEAYEVLSSFLRRRILNEFYSANGRCCCDTQTGLLLTLRHHLAPVGKTVDRLLHKFRESNYKLNCGFTGAPIMCRILTENGMGDIAAKLLLNEKYPGWLYEVKMGATTVWERWNSLDETGHISSTGMNSLNHYAYGSILEWIFRDVAGIAPAKPGFVKVEIKPQIIWKLGHVSAEYRSAAGLYKSAWRILDENHLEITVTVPFGAEADLILPLSEENGDRVIHLTSGQYTKTYKTAKPLHVTFSTKATKLKELLDDPDARQILISKINQVENVPPEMREEPLRVAIANMHEEANIPEAILDAIDGELANI